jgi:vitamin K-dependent gamma-carboxylase-like protein
MRHRLTDATDRFRDEWNHFWFEPVSTSTFALFRVAFGALVFLWTVSLSPSLLAFFSKNGILPEHPTFGTGTWGMLDVFESDAAVVVVYFALLGASVFLTFGFKTRLAAFIVFVCLVSLMRRNPWILNSGDLFVRVLSFYMLFMPAAAAISVDRWLRARRNFWEFPAKPVWPLRLVQIQVSILYLSAVWDKVRGTTWNDGTAVSYALRLEDLERFPVPGFITDSLLVSNVLTFGTLAVELALGILVWNRKLRPWVLLAGVSLHLGIDYAVRVGFFSYVVLVAYIAFLPPETVESWLTSLRAWWARRRSESRATRSRLARLPGMGKVR